MVERVLQYIVLILVVINAILACYKILSYDCNTKNEMFHEIESILSKILILALFIYFIFK